MDASFLSFLLLALPLLSLSLYGPVLLHVIIDLFAHEAEEDDDEEEDEQEEAEERKEAREHLPGWD